MSESLPDRLRLHGLLVAGGTWLKNGEPLSEAADELDRLTVEVSEMRSLLSAAECPTCDGRGWYVEGPNYHNPHGEQVQCEWCDRRRSCVEGGDDE